MSDATPIDPSLGEALLGIEKPARYTGGEYGIMASSGAPFQTAVAFPDLYEIGMSNQALRILYNRLNEIPGISCDRVFAPAPDFEALLRERSIPLYALDTGIPLGKLDLLLFTLGYELGITSVLAMLDLAGIPIRREQRGEGDPVVIMGGPCVSNPLPYAAFIDAFWIGEAEAGFFDLAKTLAGMKGEGRGKLLRVLEQHPHIWTRGKGEVLRAVDHDFAGRSAPAAVFPVPSMKVVQHHGAVEIMRGCPNGCRFCHAGYWYRPMRQKNAEQVFKEAEEFIRRGGYREISLSSLSSGDYDRLDLLAESLNRRFSAFHVSFQLPSLKVSTFSLDLLEKISLVRKSGLTFAVETPRESWQRAINKEVSLDSVTAILGRARKNGWRGAKLYFMIGLPAAGDSPDSSALNAEVQSVVSFVLEASHKTGIHFNVNVGVFVPKPHTPYQRMPQIGIAEAEASLNAIRSRLKPAGHKVSVSNPLISLVEGVLSRGDESCSALIEKAWRAGCRLDAWQGEAKKDVIRGILEEHRGLVQRILDGWNAEEALPWDPIKSRTAEKYFSREYSRSGACDFTSPCIENCTHPCGACSPDAGIVRNTAALPFTSGTKDGSIQNIIQDKVISDKIGIGDGGSGTWRLLFSFEKKGRAVFHSHLSVLEIFSMAFVRADIPALYSEGFNPLPRLEVVAPLSLGAASEAEMAALDTAQFVDPAVFTEQLNRYLPSGFVVRGAENYYIPRGRKKYSLSSLLWGFGYITPGNSRVIITKEKEKEFRLSLGGPAGEAKNAALYRLTRFAVLAESPAEDPRSVRAAEPSAEEFRGETYFTVYRRLYPPSPPHGL